MTLASLNAQAVGDTSRVSEALNMARRGDPAAFGQLWAFSQRCKLDPGLMGEAAGGVALTATQAGRVAKIDDFFAHVKPGLRQGNEVPMSSIDCVATNRALESLAGRPAQPERTSVQGDPHAALIARHTCALPSDDAAVRMMTSYLNEKNGLDGRDISAEVNRRASKLADVFVAPSYLQRYRVLAGSAQLNSKGSRPEQLICVSRHNGSSVVVTAITNRESGWTSIMQYRITEENGRAYMLPMQPPTVAKRRPLNLENDPTSWIDPMTVIDGLPREKD